MSGTLCFKLSQPLNKQNELIKYQGRKYSNICSQCCIAGSKPSVLSGLDVNIVCPQRTEFSPSDVSGEQSLDSEELFLLCCVIRSWRGCFYSPVYDSVQS